MLQERDFAQNPELVARPHDVVVLELEPMRRGRAVRESLARYSLDTGVHTFCLDADDFEGAGLVVEDSSGLKVLDLGLRARSRPRQEDVDAPDGRCAQTILPSGTYQLRFTHSGRLVTGGSRAAFAQAALPNPPLLDGQGKPVGGWWALRPDPRLDAERRQGRVVRSSERTVIADFTSKQIGNDALFDLHDPTRPLGKEDGGLSLDVSDYDSRPYLTLGVRPNLHDETFFRDTAPLVVTDLGQYRAQLGVHRADHELAHFFLGRTSPASFVLNYDQPRPDPAPPASVEVLFRFFPDGTQIGDLREGEIALFQECNYRGKAAVFAGRIPSLAELSSAVTTLGGSAASVKLGNNTGVILHTGAVYTGTKQIVTVDTPCLDATPIKNNTTVSLEVRLLAPTILLSTRSCVGCKLVAVDLSAFDLSGVNLDGADLTRAKLGNLRNVELPNATLDEATFSGVDHSLVVLSNASLKRVNLSDGQLYGARLNRANLEGANLSGAFLTNHPEAKIRDAASLGGAHLKNVNLSGAQLSGADFGNVSFYGDNPATDKACPASKDLLKDCASAANATMNSTNFSGAYLYGVDFQSATVQGAQFTNAVLVGASFADATLATDPNAGRSTAFTGAFLQGAKLKEARSIIQVSLSEAFLDFRNGGNELTLFLDATHTAFRGWKSPDQQACVSVVYGHATTVPEGNSTLTCPDGGPAAESGCGPATAANTRWASSVRDLAHVNPPASYTDDATYTKAAGAPVCDPPDDDW